MLSIFRKLMKNDRGATAIEYTLIASLIAVAAITAMTSVGTKVQGVLGNVANTMTSSRSLRGRHNGRSLNGPPIFFGRPVFFGHHRSERQPVPLLRCGAP